MMTRNEIILAIHNNVDLRSANLRNANLCNADLRGANVCGADLSSANLYQANLYNADLCGANLWGANLWGANLRNANLRSTTLYDTNLHRCNLVDTCLSPSNELNVPQDCFQIVDGYAIGYRTREAGHIDAYLDGRIYSADIFSTCETECHPGLYLWPTIKAAQSWSSNELICVRTRLTDIHQAGCKYRCRWFEVMGTVRL